MSFSKLLRTVEAAHVDLRGKNHTRAEERLRMVEQHLGSLPPDACERMALRPVVTRILVTLSRIKVIEPPLRRHLESLINFSKLA